ncbi:MAG TPA: hypothetical protein VK081_13190 [Planctomycetota bacterium]|nr:hypothetical protein [Planctomycetota bacterium]
MGRIAPSLLLTVAAALPLPAQTVSPGFAALARYQPTGMPAGVTALAYAQGTDTLWAAHRNILVSVDAQGAPTFAFGLPVQDWIGALAVDPNDGSVWFTDESNAVLYHHDPVRRHTRAVGRIPPHVFDLLFAGGRLLASANPAWPAPGANAGIFVLDPASGHREIARLVGPSGPIACTPNGDLLYATQAGVSPPPPSSSDIVRFAAARVAAALAGGPMLTLADATVAVRGLDGAFDLAVDDAGRVYVTDSLRGQVWRADLATGARETTPFVATGNAGTTWLAWRREAGAGTFAAFQPPGGGRLFVAVEDWMSARSTVIDVGAARPAIAVMPALPIPRGPARVEARGAAPLSPCVLCISPLRVVPEFTAGSLFGAPLWVGLDPFVAPFAWPTLADANGDAIWSFVHAGPAARGIGVQFLTLGAAGAGTSPALDVDFL